MTEDIYNKQELEDESEKFIRKLTAITQLTPNNKLGINKANELYVEYLENGHLQAWLRKLNGQSRERINDYLKKELYDYYLYLLYQKHLQDIVKDDPVIKRLRETHSSFLANINQGLNTLSEIYPDYAPLRATCDLYRTRLASCT